MYNLSVLESPRARPRTPVSDSLNETISLQTKATLSNTTSLLTCEICSQQLRNPHMLPCLHIFCLNCLRDECVGKSVDKFFCPACVDANDGGGEGSNVDGDKSTSKKSYHSRPWHSFDKILDLENGQEAELERRREALPPSMQIMESENYVKNDEDTDDTERNALTLEPPLLFPCSMHSDRLADTFCSKCDQLACHKCVSSFHRRCQNFHTLQQAVDLKRLQFDSVHDKMAANLVACEDMVDLQKKHQKEIEQMRTDILVQIKKFRTDLVNAILTKEKALTQEANRILDEMMDEAKTKNNKAGKLAKSLQKQMELLDISFSVKGEAELLPLLPSLTMHVEADSKTIGKHYGVESLSQVSFLPDESCKSALDANPLGWIHTEGSAVDIPTSDGEQVQCDSGEKPLDLNLTLLTSFHGGCRDDHTQPLLTDLIIITNGDIILTDRDNRCVKKFNQTGKLLTRVVLDAIPSRISTVSHARAVVSVMNKKLLYFLSLFGTVRILNTVRVKKLYSFLTSLGDGFLAAGTNLCESIDIISERGETIRSIFTQKSDKASISRPLYLTPAHPRSLSSVPGVRPLSSSVKKENVHGTDSVDNTTMSNNNDNNINNSKRRLSNFNNGAVHTAASNPTNCDNVHEDTANQKTGINADNSTTNSSNSKSTKSNKQGNGNKSVNKGLMPLPHISKKVSTSKRRSITRTSPSPTSENKSSAPSSSLLPPTSLSSSSTSCSSTSSSSLSPFPMDKTGILVTDSGRRVMFCLQASNGSVAFTFRSNDQMTLECPLGLTVHPKGLTLLTDRDSDCVLLLDKDGRLLKKILRQEDGLSKPCAINASIKGNVVLSQVDGTIKIYKAE